MVQMIELDSGRVLLLENGEWQVKAAYFRDAIVPDPQWRPSTQILACLQQMKRGLYQVPSSAAETVSLAGIKSVAAAPILDRNGNVVGAIYGDRRLDGGTQVVRPISALEATLVELLAQAVATGLARIEEESKRLQLEQFFTRELATQLTTRRELLAGQDAEVTVLFCDVRGFSRISANLGGAKTVAWINDLMSELSECVLAHQGVLVDYIGDALMAMWGAPDDRADHAQLACLAALEMLSSTPRLNARWRDALGEPLQLSIGLNTGIARVGNIGSQRKFKYGPLGETVNIASRVQGATRYLKSALLLTRSTFEKLTDSSPARRVATVRLVNIDQPVELFELPDPNLQPPPEWKPAYESALNDFEKHRFRQATAAFRPLVDGEFEDETALVLLARAVNALVSGPEPQHPIWELPGK
jgi:adenylate cyclase